MAVKTFINLKKKIFSKKGRARPYPTKKALALDIINQINHIKIDQKIIDTSITAKKAAKEATKANMAKLKMGTAILANVLESIANEAKAKQELIKAQYQLF